MNHWTTKYIGKPYNERTNNCAHLVIEVENQTFGKQVDIVVPDDTNTFDEAIETQRCLLAEKINNPEEGDAVLLISKQRPSHIGVYAVINGEPYVLHSLENRGVCCHKISRLHCLNMEVEGYYRFKETNESSPFTTSSSTSTG